VPSPSDLVSELEQGRHRSSRRKRWGRRLGRRSPSEPSASAAVDDSTTRVEIPLRSSNIHHSCLFLQEIQAVLVFLVLFAVKVGDPSGRRARP
jgi:hypothetical protein